MDLKEVFVQKKLICDCGTSDFDTYYEIVERGLSDNYIFYARCKRCGTLWSFASAVPHWGKCNNTPYFSDRKEIERATWKLLEVEKKCPLVPIKTEH